VSAPSTRCHICHQPCIPMADYAAPTCPGCDAQHEAALERLHSPVEIPVDTGRLDDIPDLGRLGTLAVMAQVVTAETYGRLVPEFQSPAVTEGGVTALVDAVCPPRRRRRNGELW